jgi:hypothetical protein
VHRLLNTGASRHAPRAHLPHAWTLLCRLSIEYLNHKLITPHLSYHLCWTCDILNGDEREYTARQERARMPAQHVIAETTSSQDGAAEPRAIARDSMRSMPPTHTPATM